MDRGMKTLWTGDFKRNGSVQDSIQALTDFNGWAAAIPQSLHPVEVLQQGIRFQAGPLGACELVLKESDLSAGRLVFGDSNGKPFPMRISLLLSEKSAGITDINATLEGAVNPFMWAMLKKPLEGFLADRLKG
jgi:hypothetical protein